ncbi:MAG: cobalamin-dependent protein, partial [Anaerolineaceae bacterium]|nr:cobalamin-dependent protein [Anaerolineaceae bacterium]
WERRYGLPKPSRSSGGQRLYTRQDIDTIKWLQARQGEGMRIHRATELWKELVAAGRNPLGQRGAGGVHTSARQPDNGVPLDVLRRQWLDACLAFNRHPADDILNEALAMYPLERICVELFQKALNEVGERWYRGSATAQQEHFVSAQVMRRLQALIHAAPDPTRMQTIMLGCPPGELHTYPSLFLGLMLRRKGYKVIDLGADIPLEEMLPTITAIRPDLVIFTAQQLTTAAAILSAANLLKGWGVPLAYGGLVFNRIPTLTTLIPAHFLGDTLPGALAAIEHLLSGVQAQPVIDNSVNDWSTLLEQYHESRPRIELAVYAGLPEPGLPVEQLRDVNAYLGDRLETALKFGDPALIDPDLEWLSGLLSTHHLSADLLAGYLRSYMQVLAQEMGSNGKTILDWMTAFLSRNTTANQVDRMA